MDKTIIIKSLQYYITRKTQKINLFFQNCVIHISLIKVILFIPLLVSLKIL